MTKLFELDPALFALCVLNQQHIHLDHGFGTAAIASQQEQ